MKRGILIAAGLAAVAVVAAAAALPIVEQQLAEAIKARLGRRAAIQVARVEVGLLARRIVLSDLALVRPGEEKVSVGRLDLSGISWPIGDLLAGRTPFTGWQWGDPIDIARVEAVDLKVSRPAESVEWRVKLVVFDGIDLPRYQPHKVPPPPGSLAHEMRAISRLSIRRFEQRGLEFTQDASPSRVSIAGTVMEDFSSGLVGSLVVTGTEMFDGQGAAQLAIGEFRARRFDLSQPIRRMQEDEWEPGMSVGRAWFEELSLDGIGGTLLTDDAVSIGRIVIQSRRDGVNASGRTRIESIGLRPAPDNPRSAQVLAMLAMLNLQELMGSFDCRGGEDRAKGELNVEKCLVSGPDLAELEFNLKLVDGDEAFWRAVDEGDLTLMLGSGVGLGSATLTLRDSGLLKRLVELHGRTNRLTPAESRAVMAKEIRRFQPTGVLITEDMTKLADTVAKFVEQGGTLTFTARPDPPLTIDGSRALWAPGPDLISVLGLTATHKK